MFLLALFDRVSLELPVNTSCLFWYRTGRGPKVPTLYVSVSVVAFCLSKTSASKTSPTPISSESVIKRVKSLLIFGHLNCEDRERSNRNPNALQSKALSSIRWSQPWPRRWLFFSTNTKAIQLQNKRYVLTVKFRVCAFGNRVWSVEHLVVRQHHSHHRSRLLSA